ncbi:MAG: DUF4411 family protein [Spirochaetaceae bacterium]|jgi:hypothetical protein|nr:DUF4411 family protein [Spirochaetaceae bacterium]
MVNGSDEIFIIDSNAMLAPYHAYYSFEIAPTFWEIMRRFITAKNIVVLDKVYEEITAKEDGLSRWLKAVPELEPLKYNTPGVVENYGLIIGYLQSCGLYTNVAFHEWSQEKVADPWIVAAAKTYNYTVISFENRIHNLSAKNPSNKPKIPDICDQLRINCHDLFYMMNKLGVKL